MVIFVQINSPIFLFASIANLALAAFFGINTAKRIKRNYQIRVRGSRIYVSTEGTVLSEPLTPVKQEV